MSVNLKLANCYSEFQNKQIFSANLRCACHQNKSEMLTPASLLALTDPRSEKCVCLLTCVIETDGTGQNNQTIKQINWL